jgi:hypothetical protein
MVDLIEMEKDSEGSVTQAFHFRASCVSCQWEERVAAATIWPIYGSCRGA